jgi:hypothetical protein
VLAGLVLATGVLLYHETRGTTLWFDEWTWLLHRRDDSPASYLNTHNGHLSLIPVAIYKLLFATAGIKSSSPYRALVIVAHLTCCVLLFGYARRRVGELMALIAAVLLLLFGPGWENLLWSFQITWLISLGAGLAALLALDRADRAGDLGACALLVCSLASSGIGVPIVVGVALELVLVRRRLRDAWIVAVPLGLYGLWWIGFQHTAVSRHAIPAAPDFVYRSASATLSALAGLGGATGFDGPGMLMRWGPPLLIAALAAIAWRLFKIRRRDPRVASLATMAISFWLLTAVTRSFISSPFASRYLYVGGFFVLLLAVQLLDGVRLTRWVSVVLSVAALAAIASNLGALRDAGGLYRASGRSTTAVLGALEIGRPVIPRGYVAQQIPGYPFVVIPAAAYFAATRSVGSPAASETEIAADPEPVRTSVDTELIHIHRLGLRPLGSAAPRGRPPAIDSVVGGSVRVRGACVTVVPSAVAPASASVALAVKVPAQGLVLQSAEAPATVSARRFADGFQTVSTLAAAGGAALVITRDRSARRWHVRLVSTRAVLACGLGG